MASNTGWTSVGERLMTRRTSPVAVCVPSDVGELAVARLQLGEQAHVLDGDDRLVGEGLEERDLLVGEGPDLGSADPDHAERDTVAQERHGERRLDAVPGRGRLGVLRQSLREVPDMNRLAVDHRAAHQVSPSQPAHRGHRRRPEGGDEAEHVAVHAKHLGVVRAAQAGGIRGNGVEHRLSIGRRGRDHAEDLARGRLLLQRLAEVLLRASSSLNRRTFSMAMTAWSAKVWSSAICAP